MLIIDLQSDGNLTADGVFLCIIINSHSSTPGVNIAFISSHRKQPLLVPLITLIGSLAKVIHPTAKTYSNLLPSYVYHCAACLQSAAANLSFFQTMALLKIVDLKTIS